MSEGNFFITAYTDISKDETRLQPCKIFTPFKWCIENFRLVDPKFRVSIHSPSFRIDQREEATWSLQMILKQEIDIAFLIIRNIKHNGDKMLIVTVILDNPRKVQRERFVYHADQMFHVMEFNDDMAAIRDLFMPTLNDKNLGNGLITVLVEIQNSQTDNSMQNSTPAGSGLVQLSRDMMGVLRDSRFSDLTLTAEGRDIKAHKVILSARSEVFHKMFQHPMTESVANRVEISDMTFETLAQFVNYLYSGSVEGLTVELAMKMFVASDKYAVKELQDTCGRFLEKNISVGNCVEILVLADRHVDAILKETALKFCIENGREICSVPNWDVHLKTEPQLLCELFKSSIMK